MVDYLRKLQKSRPSPEFTPRHRRAAPCCTRCTLATSGADFMPGQLVRMYCGRLPKKRPALSTAQRRPLFWLRAVGRV